MINVHTSTQSARKWKQIEDNFTGDIIGKVDQILGSETNSELWKASVLLLKWRKSTLTSCPELDVFTLMLSSQLISYLPHKHPTTKHGTKIIKVGNSGGNIESPEPGIVRRSWVPRTGKIISGESPLNPFQLMFVTFPVWSPKRCTILNDWSNKSNKQFLHGYRIVRQVRLIRTNSPPNKSKQTFSLPGNLVNMRAPFKIWRTKTIQGVYEQRLFQDEYHPCDSWQNGTMRSSDVLDHNDIFGDIGRKFVDVTPGSYSIQIGFQSNFNLNRIDWSIEDCIISILWISRGHKTRNIKNMNVE